MREFGEEIGASGYFTDFEAAAKHSESDAAIVATPSNLHIDPARVLLSSGIHVLMEKPLCTSVAEAIELKPLVRDSGLVFMMAHTFRFRFRVVGRRILETNPLGHGCNAEFMGGWYLPDGMSMKIIGENMRPKNWVVASILTSLSHLFDLVAWFFGDIKNH
jgi:predicted dehydrogenase